MFGDSDAMIVNKLKNILTNITSLTTFVKATRVDISNVNTAMSKETTSQQILTKLNSGGDVAELNQIVNGYIKETGNRYVPMRTARTFFIGTSIDSSTSTEIGEQAFTWTAEYTGNILVGADCAARKSSYPPYVKILRNGNVVMDISPSSTTLKLAYYVVAVQKNDVITIDFKKNSNTGWTTNVARLFIAYDIISTTTLNTIKSIQKGYATASKDITISPVDVTKAIPLVMNGAVASFDGYTLSVYTAETYVSWVVIEFY